MLYHGPAAAAEEPAQQSHQQPAPPDDGPPPPPAAGQPSVAGSAGAAAAPKAAAGPKAAPASGYPHLTVLDLTGSCVSPGLVINVEELQATCPNLEVLSLEGVGALYGAPLTGRMHACGARMGRVAAAWGGALPACAPQSPFMPHEARPCRHATPVPAPRGVARPAPQRLASGPKPRANPTHGTGWTPNRARSGAPNGPGWPRLRSLRAGALLQRVQGGAAARMTRSALDDALLVRLAAGAPGLTELGLRGSSVSAAGLGSLVASSAARACRAAAAAAPPTGPDGAGPSGVQGEPPPQQQLLLQGQPAPPIATLEATSSALCCDEGLWAIGDAFARSLRVLEAARAGGALSDEGLEGLYGCRALRALDVSGSSVTDEGAARPAAPRGRFFWEGAPGSGRDAGVEGVRRLCRVRTLAEPPAPPARVTPPPPRPQACAGCWPPPRARPSPLSTSPAAARSRAARGRRHSTDCPRSGRRCTHPPREARAADRGGAGAVCAPAAAR